MDPRRLRASLLACGLLLLGLPLLAGLPTATALSCVPGEQVARDAAHLFTGRITGSRGDRIRVEVERVRPGDRVEATVWLKVEIGYWMPWLPAARAEATSGGPEPGVPEHYRDPRLWLFAADADWVVNACSAWVGELDEMRLTPVLAELTAPPEVRPAGVSGTPPKIGAALAGLILGALILGVSMPSRSH